MRITPRAGDGSPRRLPLLVDVEAHQFDLAQAPRDSR
jgi:hypothetical protein